MQMIIDRFEGEIVVLEYEGRTFDLPRVFLPKEAREGDVVILEATLDPEDTDKQSQKINLLMDELFED